MPLESITSFWWNIFDYIYISPDTQTKLVVVLFLFRNFFKNIINFDLLKCDLDKLFYPFNNPTFTKLTFWVGYIIKIRHILHKTNISMVFSKRKIDNIVSLILLFTSGLLKVNHISPRGKYNFERLNNIISFHSWEIYWVILLNHQTLA